MIEVHVNGGAASKGVAALLDRGVRATLSGHGVTVAEVSVTLLPDKDIQALNLQYLGHDRPTDVLSFALYGPDEPLLGDLYIGWDQAGRQSGELGIPLDEEVLRLTIHGTLHVLGHDHPEGAERSGSEFFALQEALLRAVLSLQERPDAQ